MQTEKIIIKKYHEDIWNTNESIRNYINNYFDSYLIQNKPKAPEANGLILSTSGSGYIWILKNPELQPLITWIRQEFLEAAKEFYGTKYNSAEPYRMFANKMYINSSVVWHNHKFEGLVGIFYLNVPENGAKLLTETRTIATQNGELLIHEGNLPHAVSTHLSEEPRVVLVLEVNLI